MDDDASRVTMTIDEFRNDPAAATEQALTREVAILDASGRLRMVIARLLKPLEDDTR